MNDVKVGKINDRQGLAQLSDYAASFTPNDSFGYLQNMGATLTGHAEGHAGLTQGLMEVTNSLNLNPIIDFHPNYKVIQNKTELMQSGYSYDFKDPPGSGGNQARHFWFYVQVSYESGHRIGISANYLHETIVNDGSGKSVQDYALGIEGLILGEALASGNIKPGGVGSWIDRTLAPRLTDGEKK